MKHLFFIPVLILILSCSDPMTLYNNSKNPQHFDFDETVDESIYDYLVAMNDDIPSSGGVFYVDADGPDDIEGTPDDGNDTNPGTETLPWATIRKATLTLEAGDTVYVKAGTYNESVYFYNSGNADDGYITYRNFENDTVVIDGTGIGEYENGIDMDGFINNQGKSYIRFDGFIVQNYTTWFGIYFRGPADHLVIRNCTVTNGNKVDENDWGGHSLVIWAQMGDSGPIDHVILEGNHVYDNNTGGNEQFTIYGEVSNFKILNNRVHDGTNINMDMIGRIEYQGVAFGRPTRGLVKANICYNSGENSWGSGIYSDGAGRPDVPDDIIIEDNICWGNDYCGIEIGDEHPGEQSGGMLIRNNIVYDNQYYGIHIGASGPDGGEVNNIKVYNNVSYQNLMGAFVVSYSFNIRLLNNIFYRHEESAAGAYYMLVPENARNVTFDYNCWYLGDNAAWFIYEGVEYPGFQEYRAATGQDSHSVVADPLFNDPSNGDFRLQAGSPCINAGIDIGAAVVPTNIGKQYP